MYLLTSGVLFASLLLAQSPSSPSLSHPALDDSEELVRIEKIAVTGTRLNPRSVQMLTGLRPGQQINESSLRKAIQRMTESGLVKNVDYAYESLSGPTSVAVQLTIVDEAPLLPASIQLPEVDAEDVWAYLKNVDPVFTRELPRTQKAIQFYVRYIERYLANQGKPQRVASVITGDGTGGASGIIFVPSDLLGVPRLRRQP